MFCGNMRNINDQYLEIITLFEDEEYKWPIFGNHNIGKNLRAFI
jgi:hypothetical protein